MSATTHSAILIVGPAWVGDMVMAQSLFKILQRFQRGVAIDVLAPRWTAELLERMPEVRHVIDHSFGHGQWNWQERRRLGQELRQKRYQQAIILPRSWKSALIPFWAQIPQRTGYLGELRYGLLNDIRSLNKLTLQKTIEQFVALGMPAHEVNTVKLLPKPRLIPRDALPILKRLNLEISEKPLLILCPGAEYGPAKRWPAEYFAIVAKRKIAEGWKVWIIGSEKDEAIGANIQALAGENCVNLCGNTKLAEAVDLLASAQAVVTNDSGLMHIAAALDKPLVALFGSSSPAKTPPLSETSHILQVPLPCNPCFRRTCRYEHYQCLRDLRPEQVLDILKLY